MKALTVAHARAVAQSIASAVGADPRGVIVRGQAIDDRTYLYYAQIARDVGVEATGDGRRDALERLYDALLEREASVRRHHASRRAKCGGKRAGDDPGTTCRSPRMYSFAGGALRDSHAVRTGHPPAVHYFDEKARAHVPHPDASFVYAEDLNDLSRRVTRASTKNGKARKRRVTRARRSR